MKKISPMLIASPLFAHIPQAEFPRLLQSLTITTKTYQKDEHILVEGAFVNMLNLLLTGKVLIQQEDIFGNTTIISKVSAGDLFAESYVCGNVSHSPVSVVAAEDTQLLLIDYQDILFTLDNHYHVQLIKNILQIIAEKNIKLVQRMSFITKRTIREKVLAYLSAISKQKNSASFTIPYNRQELADFLAVDRSALSKELGKLKKEGFLTFKKSQFQLFY
ncbi:cyclic nucleotide-binding domain-containing protein [Erwinia sp. CPCC 100877]|nr:cyclic nucleotide-binding domain-containing protein [Erwinia sp. CPCC 100877]